MASTLNSGLSSNGRKITPSTLATAPVLICPKNRDPAESQDYVYFSYLNEGGANVVFKIHEWPHSDPPSLNPALFTELIEVNTETSQLKLKDRAEVIGHVLRVNKGLDKTLRCDEVVYGFYHDVRPLFSPGEICVHEGDANSDGPRVVSFTLPDHDFTEYLMEHQIVSLFPSVMRNLTAMCSVICKENSAQTLTTKRWGILLPDMSSKPGSSITLEIKPKWLLQSPNAPKSAIRCRTCALQSIKAKDSGSYFCPLRVVAGDQEAFYTWVLTRVHRELAESESVSESLLSSHTSTIAMCIAKYLTQGNGFLLLKHLRMLQGKLDPYGVLKRDDLDRDTTFERNLRLAMTLRDCSIYLNVSYTAAAADPSDLTTKIECKLGDLDFKSADKMDDWADKERSLLESAAYTEAINDDISCLLTVSRNK